MPGSCRNIHDPGKHMLPEGLEYHNGNGTLCIIGEMDQDKYTLKEQFAQSVD